MMWDNSYIWIAFELLLVVSFCVSLWQIQCHAYYIGQYESNTDYLVTLSGLEPAIYRIRLIVEGEPGDRNVFRRSFTIPDNPLDCSPYLVNNGIVSDNEQVTVTFTSTGLYDSFTCQLDYEQPVPCKTQCQDNITVNAWIVYIGRNPGPLLLVGNSALPWQKGKVNLRLFEENNQKSIYIYIWVEILNSIMVKK